MIGLPALLCLFAVVNRAEAIIDGVHDGCNCLISAATPPTCGAAMLVPDSSAKRWPERIGSAALIGLHAAHICWPGASMSGFSTSAGCNSQSKMSGPLDENRATTGACVDPAKVGTLPSLIAALAWLPTIAPFTSQDV